MRTTHSVLRSIVLGVTLLGVAGAGQAQNVYSHSAAGPLASNQVWTLSLGTYFSVTSATAISGLGVFDSGADGFITGTTIEAALFTSAGTLVPGSLLSFTPGSPGFLDAGSFRFKSLSAAVNLTPGSYAVVARGFNSRDGNYNSFGGASSITATSPAAGITLTGSAYNANDGSISYPTIADGTDPARYGAVSMFITVPEPTTLALLGLGFAPIALRRRRK